MLCSSHLGRLIPSGMQESFPFINCFLGQYFDWFLVQITCNSEVWCLLSVSYIYCSLSLCFNLLVFPLSILGELLKHPEKLQKTEMGKRLWGVLSVECGCCTENSSGHYRTQRGPESFIIPTLKANFPPCTMQRTGS